MAYLNRNTRLTEIKTEMILAYYCAASRAGPGIE
jgi:hypothetical protein